MPNVAVSASVSTQTSPLVLTNSPYALGAGDGTGPSNFSPGQVVYSRVWATSAYVAGAVQVWSVPGEVSASLKVWITETAAAGWPQMMTDLTALIDAFQQSAYVLSLDIGGQTFAWNCVNADYEIDDYPMEAVVGLQLGATFTIPRSPIPVSGPV